MHKYIKGRTAQRSAFFVVQKPSWRDFEKSWQKSWAIAFLGLSAQAV
jgi:hypothetical protein